MSAIELLIEERARPITDDFTVGRLLPTVARRHIGPFCFFDHMGPATLTPGRGLDVGPHPHIGLGTVTYLFEGEIVHRDSVGSLQIIGPRAINWMIAGRGIVHSERTSEQRRAAGSRVHGLQVWVALPAEHEEDAPSFHHHAAESLPELVIDGARIRVLLGEAYGAVSPVPVLSRMFYVDVTLPAGAGLALPMDHVERGAYVVEGAILCEDKTIDHGTLAVFTEGAEATLIAEKDTRLMLLGGESVGPRFIEWNFVSSQKERIERAKEDWRTRQFPKVVGDDGELVVMPERR